MITVGQKLYYVPANRYRRVDPTEVTVTAVGRKWVTFKDGSITERFALADPRMEVDGGEYESPGRCYISKDAYESEQVLTRRWNELVKWVDRHKWGAPSGMTVERIDQAIAVLQWQDLPLMEAKVE